MKEQIIAKLPGRIWSSILFCLLIVIACQDSESLSMEVWRDCTGTYLQQGELDYKVCNPGTLDGFTNGQTIEVSFALSVECEDPAVMNYACNLYHGFDKLIYIKNIIE